MFELRMSTHLNLEQVKARVKKATVKPLAKCAAIVEAAAKRNLSKGGKKKVPAANKRDDKGRFLKHEIITEPSAPGEAPHLQTGNLRSSISSAPTQEGTYVVGPTAAAWYGQVHEFGGKNHPKRPFMRPALIESADKFPEQFGNLDLGGSVTGGGK